MTHDPALESIQADPRPDISVIVPVYKEEEGLRPFLDRLVPALEPFQSYEVIFCVDPSPDRSVEVIEEFAAQNPRIGMLLFSRRFGQPAAVVAGLLHCSGSTAVVIDVDLQDPPELIPELHAKLADGYEVVYAKRRSRRGETLLKRFVSWLGYKVINQTADVDIPRDTGDFRIVTRRVIEQLRLLSEKHGFLRGLVAFVGFRQTYVLYDRDERAFGQGHYNRYLGSLRIGFNGLVGFSNFLLSLTLWIGVCISVLASFFALFVLTTKLFLAVEYPIGVPSILILVLFMGGAQLVSIGVLGEYIGRIYDEVKDRPQYIVDRAVNIKAPTVACTNARIEAFHGDGEPPQPSSPSLPAGAPQ